MFFKGFVKTKDKKCTEKFKNRTDFKTLEQVQSLDEYAGILADDAVLIDVDDGDQAELLMDIVEHLQLNCRVYQTTRGKHFLFKNVTGQIQKCFTKTNLGCGLTADIKVGVKNSYEVLKFDGKERFIEWDIEEGQEYDLARSAVSPDLRQHITQIPLAIVDGGSIGEHIQGRYRFLTTGDGGTKEGHGVAGSKPGGVCNGGFNGVGKGSQTLNRFQQVVLGAGADVDEVVTAQLQRAVFPAVHSDGKACFTQFVGEDCHIAVLTVKAQQLGQQMKDLDFFHRAPHFAVGLWICTWAKSFSLSEKQVTA